MITGFVGQQSAGKSQLIATRFRDDLITSNKALEERRRQGLPDVFRTFATDSPLSDSFIQEIESYGHSYLFFKDLSEILHLTSIVCGINEITKFFPANGSKPLTPEQVEFLSQAAKDGISIYFCCQDFSQVHKHFRFLVNELYLVTKLIGSDRPCKSMPPISRIWGLVLYWPLDPRSFKADNTETERLTYWPRFYLINREDTELYDTSYKVRGINLPPVTMIPQEYIYLDVNNNVVKKETKYQKR